MPTVDLSLKDLGNLLGKSISASQLEDLVLYAKGEVESVQGDKVKLDIKDTNRPDLWSAEGIAREINLRLGKSQKIKFRPSGHKLYIEKSVSDVRPLCYAAVIRDVTVTEELLVQMINLQEKMNTTHGRRRRECGIGLYDFSRMTPPLYYRGCSPRELKFAPLGFREEMWLDQILDRHPKGVEFAHLLKGKSRYPIIVDSRGVVGAMPPIINSNTVGKVTRQTRDIFIEATGFRHDIVMTELLVSAWALADRGGKVETLEVVFPGGKKITSPDFTLKKASLNLDYARKLIGLPLKEEEIYSLLEKSGYHVVSSGPTAQLEYPSYRQDIMHQMDIVEDMAISYGYNKIPPEAYRIPTIGGQSSLALLTNSVTDLLIGIGLQEIMSYTLTSRDSLLKKMLLPDRELAEIENPVSGNWSVFRSWLLPGLLEFLSRNKHVDYPQKVFEVGDCILPDQKAETRTRDSRMVGVALTDVSVNYQDISSLLDAFLASLGVRYALKKTIHPSFLPGRVAEIFVKNKSVGFIGELHPQVLNNWSLEKPVVAFELELKNI